VKATDLGGRGAKAERRRPAGWGADAPARGEGIREKRRRRVRGTSHARSHEIKGERNRRRVWPGEGGQISRKKERRGEKGSLPPPGKRVTRNSPPGEVGRH